MAETYDNRDSLFEPESLDDFFSGGLKARPAEGTGLRASTTDGAAGRTEALRDELVAYLPDFFDEGAFQLGESPGTVSRVVLDRLAGEVGEMLPDVLGVSAEPVGQAIEAGRSDGGVAQDGVVIAGQSCLAPAV